MNAEEPGRPRFQQLDLKDVLQMDRAAQLLDPESRYTCVVCYASQVD